MKVLSALNLACAIAIALMIIVSRPDGFILYLDIFVCSLCVFTGLWKEKP
jgi:hypothetical protein